ncbi:hypothetical protein GCM10009837_74700 [Streptomyces durmitorensis]|uniref:Uncharacterized protein n=1 Tax=Streptomyces durmitorensis TaxID=319947 RepID=A0ABY4PJJ4_9ACTN|nr:hypothetical protein [Streptomyces durmitorensis]UQT53807.1 hypothetical protein M4V62_01245 [Streptomyces durmitorensis]
MAAESFSAAGETSGTGEPLVSTSVHWGTAQLGAPTRDKTAPWPQEADHDTDGVPPEATAYDADGGPSEQAPPDTDDGAPEEAPSDTDDDAVEELIRVAVVSRPLDDVVDLVTLLEQSPDGVTTAASVLRLAAVARSVDDVTRLVELLGPPEHPAEHMDEAIRHAAEERPIPEVSRLVHLLSRPPHDPHSGAEAVHAAGTTRSVEDLMQLIGSLREQQGADSVETEAPDNTADSTRDSTRDNSGAKDPEAPSAASAETVRPASVPAAEAAPAQSAPLLVWLRRVAGVLLLLCAAAHFPVNWSDASALGLSVALGVSVLCALAGVALILSGSPVVAVASTLVAGALAVSHLVDDRVDSKTLAYVLRPDGVAAPLPALSAVVAALAALLVVALTVAGLRAAANRDPAARS